MDPAPSKGVGAALAGRIVKKFREDTFRIIEEEPERLAEVKGISERKAREIAVQVEEKKDMRQAMIYPAEIRDHPRRWRQRSISTTETRCTGSWRKTLTSWRIRYRGRGL